MHSKKLIAPLLLENLLRDASPTLKKLIIQSLQETESLDLNALIAPIKNRGGEIYNLKDNSQAKEKTQDGFGIHTYLMSGVTLQISYGDTDVKTFKLKQYEAEEFIRQVNKGTPFPCIKSEANATYIPSNAIKEIRIEEEDVPQDIKSEG